MKIVAEIKTHSPFGYQATKSWRELFAVAQDIGSIISVHTDPRWHGSFDFIKKAKKLTKKPILAKGLHETDEEIRKALDFGADYVLVVGRMPQIHLDKCWLEPNSLQELSLLSPTTKVVWNSRDLQTGKTKAESFSQARRLHSGWLCQASNIKTVADINPQAEAVLIGTHLIEFAQSYKKTLPKHLL